MDQATAVGLTALITAVGGLMVAVTGRLLPSKDKQMDDLAQFRKDLVADLDAANARADRIDETLNKRIADLQTTLDKWKNDYYNLLGQYNELKAQVGELKVQLHLLRDRRKGESL